MGFHHTCAILDDQSVKCWGKQDGELGLALQRAVSIHHKLSTLSEQIAMLYRLHWVKFTCALLDDGSIKCWGEDNEGQLMAVDTIAISVQSAKFSYSLPAGRTATQITAGAFHVCALLDDASVVCWGKNHEGQLGDGSTTDRNTPVTTGSFGSGPFAILHLCWL